MLRAAFALVAAAIFVGAGSAAPVRPESPVMVGGDAEFDACTSTMQVAGLDPRGDNFLSLRSRPSAKARELARLGGGQVVWACDASADGKWTGVLVSPPGDNVDCGVGTPISRRQPYRGACASGWAATRFLVMLAG